MSPVLTCGTLLNISGAVTGRRQTYNNQWGNFAMRVNLMPALLVSLMATFWPLGVSADSDSHRQAVEKLLELTEMQGKIAASVDNVVTLQLMQDPAMREHEGQLRSFLEKYIGWDSMKDELIVMYQQAFSEAELNEMNAFYSTPTAQKMLRRLPELIQERDRLAMQRLQAHIRELQQEIAGDAGNTAGSE